MFSSTIIATIDHPKLSQAVHSVIDQDFDAAGYEVIVVNDTGEPLPDADWHHSERVRIITTQKRERSVARNTGAAIARGKYLHFLDQDDTMLPGALQAFWELDRSSDAVWLYGGYQVVDNSYQLIGEYHPIVPEDFFLLSIVGEIIPLQASMLQTETFFTAGAFDPEFIIVEDVDLERRISFIGNVAKTPAAVARIRTGREGSTGDWTKVPERWRWSREKTLKKQGVFSRLNKLAGKDHYIHGRVSRQYLASMVWNYKRIDFWTFISRFLSFLAFTGYHALSRQYWIGLSRSAKNDPQQRFELSKKRSETID